MNYFKVLVNGKSFHGGDLAWSLPTKKEDGSWTPGEWHTVDGKLQMCGHPGIHITSEPTKWSADNCEYFIAEPGEETLGDGGDKISCRSVRLLRIANHEELAGVRVFVTGEHEIDSGTCVIKGDAKVAVSGNATVESVSGNATVESVYGNATVESVSGDATVESVSGNATVESVYGNATVRSVYGNATVEYVYGDATVKSVCGDATVEYVYDNATVRSVYGNATVASQKSTVAIKPTGYAVVIDRSCLPPKVFCGWNT